MLISKLKYHPLRALCCACFLLSFVFCLGSYAQDTTFRYYPHFTKYYLINQTDSAYSIDTAINFFYRHHPAEKPFGYLHLGHLGAPESPMFLVPRRDADIDIGFHQFDLYWRRLEDVKFYNTREPFTAFGYQQGVKTEVLASLVHAQNITPNLSVGIDYNRMRTDGWYLRQVTKISNFNAYFHYHSPDNLYHGIVAYVLNSLKVQENGGVENESLFSDPDLFDKSLASVNLDSAQATWKNDEVVVINALNIGKWVITEKKDSVLKRKIDPAFRLMQRFEWEKRSYLFSDSRQDGFFYHQGRPLIWRLTRDSLLYDRFTNEIRLMKLQRDTLSRAFKFSATGYFRHSIYNIQNLRTDQRVQSGILGADFSTLFFSRLKLSSFGQLNFMDRNRGDFVLNATLQYFLSKQRIAGVNAGISRNHPSIIQQEYHAAFFNWKNDFDPMTILSGSIFYQDEKWKLKIAAGWFSQSNYIYWIGQGMAVQLNGSLSGVNVSLAKDFTLWRLHLDNELMYQTFNSDTSIAFPAFILRSSFYYKSDLFNHALQTQFGIEVHYNNDYFAPAYQPALGQFPVQRNSELHYVPLADIFLVVRIKAVRGFMILQNMGQGLLGSGNFSAYRYPMPDRSFKLGLQWLFWN